MAKRIGKIMFPNGTYLKDNEEKTRWLECGSLLETPKGFRIKLDCVPVNMQEGWFNVFEIDDAQHKTQPAKQKESGGLDDDIPF